jgi:thiol-disulfide isomerase/thioredoxin
MRSLKRLVFAGIMVAGVGVCRADVPAAAQHAFDEGAKYEQNKQLPAAIDNYQAALKAAGGHCLACLEATARVQMKLALYKDAAATDAQMVKEAPDAAYKAQAEYREGLALFVQYFAQSAGREGIEKDPKRASAALKQADAVLAQGVVDAPKDEGMRMLHGRVLAAEKRDEDAGKEFAACAVAEGISAEECARAKHFEKDVSVARDEPAPAFTLTAIDGKKVSLDSLAGKVVLVDFWATWCTYCVRDSDYVQTMVEGFDAKDFVLLEVSADEDEAKWRDYVSDHRLEGLQTRDDKEAAANLFRVTGYPTYLVLDGDGSVRMRAVGIEGDLKGTVRKLIADQKQAAGDARPVLPKGGSE